MEKFLWGVGTKQAYWGGLKLEKTKEESAIKGKKGGFILLYRRKDKPRASLQRLIEGREYQSRTEGRPDKLGPSCVSGERGKA